MAIDDGTSLDDQEFAGADLLVARAEVLQSDAIDHEYESARRDAADNQDEEGVA